MNTSSGNKIRTLHSVSTMNRAGLETMLMNFYRNINRDEFDFCFLSNKPTPADYDNEIASLGGIVYKTPYIRSLSKYKNFLKKFFSENYFDILHIHNGPFAYYVAKYAKKNGIKIIIFHAHNSKFGKSLKYPMKLYFKNKTVNLCTHKVGCSNLACDFFFGVPKPGFKHTVIRNATDASRFIFNNSSRAELRSRLNLQDKLVIGHVGRFFKPKNHTYIIKILESTLKINPSSVLLLVGDGHLKHQIETEVSSLGLDEHVIFCGNVANVHEFYQAFDVFILPSLSEGLPLVGIEAQAAGLPCIFADTVSKEVCVTPNCLFLPILDSSLDMWSSSINGYANFERTNTSSYIKESGYEIKEETKRLEAYYLSLINEIKQ